MNVDPEFGDSEDLRNHNEFTVLGHKLFFLNDVLILLSSIQFYSLSVVFLLR